MKKINLGKIKVWQQRLATYISMVNFAMIFYLYIIESPMGLEWYHWVIIIVVGISVLVFVDTVFIMPDSLGYLFLKNPEWQKMKHNQKRIMDKLGLGDSYE